MPTSEIRRVLRSLIAERKLEEPLARGDAHDVRSVERDVLTRLAHAPPPAVLTAVAEEVARLQEARRQAWLRAERARARKARVQVERAGADAPDEALGDPRERVGHEAADARALAAEIEDIGGLVSLGPIPGVTERYFAISVERRVRHPAVNALIESARAKLGLAGETSAAPISSRSRRR